jgi:hypothetical protein
MKQVDLFSKVIRIHDVIKRSYIFHYKSHPDQTQRFGESETAYVITGRMIAGNNKPVSFEMGCSQEFTTAALCLAAAMGWTPPEGK